MIIITAIIYNKRNMDGKSYVKQIIINYFISHSYLGRHAHIIPIFQANSLLES